MICVLAAQFSYKLQFPNSVYLHQESNKVLIVIADMTPAGDYAIFSDNQTIEELQSKCNQFDARLTGLQARFSYLPYIYEACEIKIQISRPKTATAELVINYAGKEEFRQHVEFLVEQEVEWQLIWGVLIAIGFVTVQYVCRYVACKLEERKAAFMLYNLVTSNKQRRMLKTAVEQSYSEVFDYKRYYCRTPEFISEVQEPKSSLQDEQIQIDNLEYVVNLFPVNPENCNRLIELAARLPNFAFYLIVSLVSNHISLTPGSGVFDCYTYEDIFERFDMENYARRFFLLIATKRKLEPIVSVATVFAEATETLQKCGLCNFLRLDYAQQCEALEFFMNFDKIIVKYEQQFAQPLESKIQSQLNQAVTAQQDGTKTKDLRALVQKELQKIDEGKAQDLIEAKADKSKATLQDVLSVQSGDVDSEIESIESCASNDFETFDIPAKMQLPSVEIPPRIAKMEDFVIETAEDQHVLEFSPLGLNNATFAALDSARCNNSNESEPAVDLELPKFEMPDFKMPEFDMFPGFDGAELPGAVSEVPNFEFEMPNMQNLQPEPQVEDPATQISLDNTGTSTLFAPPEMPIFPPLQSEIPSCNPGNPPISLASPISVSLDAENETDIFCAQNYIENTFETKLVPTMLGEMEEHSGTSANHDQPPAKPSSSTDGTDVLLKTELKNPFEGYDNFFSDKNTDLFSGSEGSEQKAQRVPQNVLKLDIAKINNSLSDMMFPANLPSSERGVDPPTNMNGVPAIFSPFSDDGEHNIAPPSTDNTPRLFPETAFMLNRFSEQMYRTSHSVKSPSSISSASMSVNNWYTDASQVDPKKLYDIIQQSTAHKARPMRECKTGKTDLLPLMPFPITKSGEDSVFPTQLGDVLTEQELMYSSPFDLLCELPATIASLLIASGPLFRLKFAIYCVFSQRLEHRLGLWGIVLKDENVTLVRDKQQVTFKCRFGTSNFAEIGIFLEVGRDIAISAAHLPAEKRHIVAIALELASFVYLSDVQDIDKVYEQLKLEPNNEIAAAILRVALCENIAETREVLFSILEVIEHRRNGLQDE